MTQDNDTDDSSGTTLMRRRNVLAAIGTVTVGTALAAERFDLDFSQAGSTGTKSPPLNESEANPDSNDPAFQTPWDADSLVVAVEWNEQDSKSEGLFDRYGDEELANAVAFWNDYIGANAAFDLTLTFDHHHDNPDILLKQATVTNECGPEYNRPGVLNSTWSADACLETLRETPAENDLPVTGIIGLGGSGRNVYRLLAKHAIGRLLGYDIWSDPVAVMNPKILTTPAHSLSPDAMSVYSDPSRVSGHPAHLEDISTRELDRVRNPSYGTQLDLRNIRSTVNNHTDQLKAEFDNYHATVDEYELGVYAEAYQKTIEDQDIQYLNETVALITDTLETYTKEELAAGPDELDRIVDRFETIYSWPETTEPHDLRIHRYVTDKIWSAWAAEQTPTPTGTDSA